MQIEPAEQLGPAFARGWRKLPDELRLEVLVDNLVSADPIRRTADGFTMRQTLYNYLAMGPEIARLAHDTFYRENSFEFRPSRRCGLIMIAQPFILPPQPLRPLIKRMTLVVDIDERDWDKLEHFSKSGWGFTNVIEITIKFEIDTFVLSTLPDSTWQMDPILNRPFFFPSKGQIMVNEDDPCGFIARELATRGMIMKTVTKQLRRLVQFGCVEG
jgi:hypothetical protein